MGPSNFCCIRSSRKYIRSFRLKFSFFRSVICCEIRNRNYVMRFKPSNIKSETVIITHINIQVVKLLITAYDTQIKIKHPSKIVSPRDMQILKALQQVAIFSSFSTYHRTYLWLGWRDTTFFFHPHSSPEQEEILL